MELPYPQILDTPEAERLQEMYGKTVVGYAQRDRRTHIGFKKALVILPLVLGLLLFLTIGGISSVHDSCSDCNTSTANGFQDFSFFMIVVTLVFVALNLFATIKPGFMWMTQTQTKEYWYGDDIEDTDPFILARRGDIIQARTNSNVAVLNRMIDDAMDL